MSTSSSQQDKSSSLPFTKAERIQQLNDIDKSITQLLQSAGLALQTLSATQSQREEPTSSRQKAFQEASDSYLTTLQKVDVVLRRNIWGLEEANIIKPEKVRKKGPQAVSGMSGRAAPEADAATADVGSMGKLDIGWLNSRSGRVGRDMEAELWEKARVFLEAREEAELNGKDVEMVS
ncbi:hypothetical protein PZA11_002187 [Diplocarpon coronariae]|uniref:Mediator of RNA polymerase II transcription subunit 11 n=1 Tax=Diplocarpon coronariae TaxID=2795749 RepID=A0A218ZDJ5_9HELO|nr:hypothetical protein JHW43_007914 [Diplocarpon mali]OWP06151.1 hypothetical protein B2J93_790 [Marssonina coronariae]